MISGKFIFEEMSVCVYYAHRDKMGSEREEGESKTEVIKWGRVELP